MWNSIYSQFVVTIYSLLFGVLLGLIYCLHSAIGLLLGFNRVSGEFKHKNIYIEHIIQKGNRREKILLAIWDVLYFILITPVCAIFMYGVNNGIIRWYIILGAMLGFTAFRLSIGRLVLWLISFPIGFIKYKLKEAILLVFSKLKQKKKTKAGQ